MANCSEPELWLLRTDLVSLSFGCAGMFFKDFWLVVFFFGAQLLHSQTRSCNSDDLQALEDFFDAIDSKIDGWGSEFSADCCVWSGVSCSSSSAVEVNVVSDTDRVVKIDLAGKKLPGILSDSIGRLGHLQYLNLSQNFLKSPLPFSLFQLPRLEVLDLSSNDFAGVVPATFSLPAVQLIDLSQNYLIGSLPPDLCHNSSRIRVLDLGFNYFSGGLPPGIGNCSFLETFSLETNDLTGNIPDDLFRLQNLTLLSLRSNQFSGQLNQLIGNLSNLVRLDISYNRFSGEIPDVFYSTKNLQFLTLETNNFTGRIPNSLLSSPTINLLNLRNNSLSSPIGINCSAMANLTSLNLGTNWFHGPVPRNLPACQRLKNINLANNNFTGYIPETFKNFQSLSYLSLSIASTVNLHSALNILQHCKNLSILVLSDNFHDEELPSDPTLDFENLKVLVIGNCRLTGVMPEWLRRSSKLQLLDLSWNRLSGSIPGWSGDFQSLFYLDLSNNSFTGEIPITMTRLPNLVGRRIDFEEASTDILFLMRRTVGGPLKYPKVLSFPPTLELSNNNLSGRIWPDFGNLRQLHVFDLKFNNLSGEIPSSLSGMTSLETLDLSHNKLTGTIPQSLGSLSFLSKFSVAYNQLSGAIPSGGQFQTFPNSSFEGNNLCRENGSPCPADDDQSSSTSRDEQDNEETYFWGSFVGSYVVVVISLVVFLGIDTRCSRLWFQAADVVCSKLVSIFVYLKFMLRIK